MSVAAAIESKLTAGLAPLRLEVADESARHAGHVAMHGHAGQGGETHFRLTIVSRAFEGQTRVARQRLVYGLLAEELAGGVHAIAMTTLTPDEADRAPR
jgi:BolA protein